MNKRGFNTAASIEYLGIKRRAFETHIMPLLAGKGTPCGNSVIYERTDLDAAWEQYKMASGSERPGESKWAKQPVSTRRKPGMTLTSTSAVNGFEGAALKVLRMHKPT
jgi:hypothetical protein